MCLLVLVVRSVKPETLGPQTLNQAVLVHLEGPRAQSLGLRIQSCVDLRFRRKPGAKSSGSLRALQVFTGFRYCDGRVRGMQFFLHEKVYPRNDSFANSALAVLRVFCRGQLPQGISPIPLARTVRELWQVAVFEVPVRNSTSVCKGSASSSAPFGNV